MVKRKLFAILVASVLLLSAIAVSAVFCDEGSDDYSFRVSGKH